MRGCRFRGARQVCIEVGLYGQWVGSTVAGRRGQGNKSCAVQRPRAPKFLREAGWSVSAAS